MIPNESSVEKDQFGYPIINITAEHLKDFPSLISWIRQQGYGKDTGLVKLRLCKSDRRDEKCVQAITKLMKKTFAEKEWSNERMEFQYVYNPSVQFTHKASHDAHIYQYAKAACTSVERKEFVTRAVKPSSYLKNDNCCTQQLASGSIDQLRHHIFDELAKSSRHLNDVSNGTSEMSPPVYGDGIVLDDNARVNIADGFSMSAGLDNILNLIKEDHGGISCPYIYSGDHKTFFPWHIEDGGLYSINYIFTGAAKLWFGISPKYFGLMEKIASGLRLDLCHTSCKAFLAGHKVLVADPHYFNALFQVPYAQVLQEPGDFILSLPFSLHSGFNIGKNLAIAANFADVPWIDLGMYAPICTCNSLQVHLDLTSIMKKHRPDLLDLYKSGSALVHPTSHPREVRYPPVLMTSAEESTVRYSKELRSGPKLKINSAFKITDRILYCPDCEQSFKGNKIPRLRLHIENHHFDQREELLRIVSVKYPSWEPKMKRGMSCPICHKFIRGDKGNLKCHVTSIHHR